MLDSHHVTSESSSNSKNEGLLLEVSETQELVRNISKLKARVAKVNSKLQDDEELIRAKDTQNRELKEKLRALEVAVRCLKETSNSNKLNCCSSTCQAF